MLLGKILKQMDGNMEYTLSITASCNGTREEFYLEFSKDNREVVIGNVCFEGGQDQHNSGYIVEDFETEYPLKDYMKRYLEINNNLAIEYFSIREKGRDKVIFTEEDM